MSKANFMEHMAPTNLHGQDLVPLDQASMRAKMRQQDEDRRIERRHLIHGVGSFPVESRDWAAAHADHSTMRLHSRRFGNGGMTMQPEEALKNPPRGNYPEMMRDTSPKAVRLLHKDLHTK